MPLKLTPEIKELLSWLPSDIRHPELLHGLNECDCECIKAGDVYWLFNTDTLSEEILFSLYADPFTIGWVAVMSSLSDIAACGGTPVGLLLSIQWDYKASDEFKKGVADGIKAAVKKSGTFLLGGDSSSGIQTSITVTSIAKSLILPLSRKGAKPGDFLCLTGKFGIAAAIAFQFLMKRPKEEFSENLFRPEARLKEGEILKSLASCCIDTSDGLVTSLGQLAFINNCGFDIAFSTDYFHSKALLYLEKHGLPKSLAFLPEHGDYQLLATIPGKNFKEAKNKIADLFILGEVTENGGRVLYENQSYPLPFRELLDRLYAYRFRREELLEIMKNEYRKEKRP